MKILFVIDSLRFGGAERQLVELIKGLDKNKFEIHLCCLINDPAGYTDIIKELGIKIRYFSREFMFDIRPILSISEYIKQMRIDLVHSFLSLGALFGVIAAKIAGVRVICSGIRDAKDQSAMYWIYKRIESVLSDCLVSNSVAGFTNRFKKNKQHFRVVYNGIDFNRFELNVTDTGNVKEELGISRFSHIVGMVANLSDYKDHQTLLDAIPLVLRRFANTCFLLIGDGPKRENLERKVKRQGLKKNVIFGGYRSDVERIYPAMDISVLVARVDEHHSEGISNSLLESMASGIPVIATTGGGTDELIVHGRNGLMVPPADPKHLAESIIDVLSNQKKASAMAKVALQDVKARFGLDRYVEDYVSLYHEVLKQR